MCFLPNPYKKTFWRVVVYYTFFFTEVDSWETQSCEGWGHLFLDVIMGFNSKNVAFALACVAARNFSQSTSMPQHIEDLENWLFFSLKDALLPSFFSQLWCVTCLLTDNLFQLKVDPICQLLILYYYVVSHTRNEIISIKWELHNQGLSQLWSSVCPGTSAPPSSAHLTSVLDSL